jgi:prevent-host-death family protein
MSRVTKTELNQQTAKVLARVSAGEKLTVTDHGRPIAVISPPQPDLWEELVASGRLKLATTSGSLSFDPVQLAHSSEEILAEIKADYL